MTVEPIRVVVAEDHPSTRAGICRLLTIGTGGGIDIVAEAGTGDEAVRAAAEHQPDVVVMDLNMPGCGGVEATRTIVEASPHIKVLVLTVFGEDDAIFAAVKAGACGYLLKTAGQDELVRAVQAVANGGFITSPEVATRIQSFFLGLRPDRPSPAFPELTRREREVLDLIAQAKSNAFIATHLTLSPKTVRNHISNIFAKLHVASRSEAIVRAREAGLGVQRSS